MNTKNAIATCQHCDHAYEHRVVAIADFEEETEDHVTTCPKCGLRMFAKDVCREPHWS